MKLWIRKMLQSFFRIYVRWRLGRDFDGVYVYGLEPVKRLLGREPLLLAANHQCWWDGLVLILLDQALQGGPGAVLMDAQNLARFPFFRALGAIALDRSHPAASLTGLRQALRHLATPGHSLWIFPQGRQRPAAMRPLGLAAGFQRLMRPARMIPVSLSYLYRETARPCILVHFGAVVEQPEQLEAALIDGQQRAAEAVDSGSVAGWDPLVAPAPWTEQDGASRLLGRFWQGVEGC